MNHNKRGIQIQILLDCDEKEIIDNSNTNWKDWGVTKIREILHKV